MKCDELEKWYAGQFSPSAVVYGANEVDEAIAELKDKLQLDEDEMAGFLQLEEDCGGGDLRIYIEELKAENEKLKQKLAEKDEEIDKQKWRGDEWAKACNQKDNEITRLESACRAFAAERDANQDAIYELRKEIESLKASHYAEMVDAGMRERRIRRALWKLKALYFYRMFQWCMEGKRLAPEDDEPEYFLMECLGKHTKRKSEWDKEADMFDDARIVCIKKSEEYNV